MRGPRSSAEVGWIESEAWHAARPGPIPLGTIWFNCSKVWKEVGLNEGWIGWSILMCAQLPAARSPV